MRGKTIATFKIRVTATKAELQAAMSRQKEKDEQAREAVIPTAAAPTAPPPPKPTR